MSIPEAEAEVEVVLWRGDGGATAVWPTMPRVVVRRDSERAIADVVAAVRTRTSLDVAVLELTNDRLDLEVLGGDGAATIDWHDPAGAPPGAAPWNRPGWLSATSAVVTGALARATGATRVGPIRQVKHWSISAILEVGSDTGTWWYKQVPPFMAHEAAVLAWLAEARPGFAPDVLARGDDWFLAPAFAPPEEERTTNDSPYGELAAMQLAALDRTAELLAIGCVDRTSPVFEAELRALAARDDLLDGPLAERLTVALPRAAEQLAELDASPIGASLVHGDLHAGNWTRHPDGAWLVFDWTDACVAHPFLDLGVLPRKDQAWRSAILDSYLEPWRAAFGAAAVEATLRAALPLSGAFQALSYQRICDGTSREDAPSWRPALAGHLGRLLDDL